jgi:hypothetical protein
LKNINDFLKIALHVLKCLQISTDKYNDYHDIVRELCAFLDKQKKSIEVRIEKKERKTIREIGVFFHKILEMKWIENFKKHYIKYLIQDLCEKIKNEKINIELYCLELDLDDLILRNKENMTNIETMNKILQNYVSFIKPLSYEVNNVYKDIYGENYSLSNDIEDNKLESFKKKLIIKLKEINNEIEKEREKKINFMINDPLLIKIDCFLKKLPLKILDINVNEVEENLRKLLRNKIDLNQIELHFNSVIRAKAEKEVDMVEKARYLSNFFISIENIKEKCKSVLDYLPTEVKEKEFLESYRIRIIDRMESNEQKELLHERNKINLDDIIANIVVTLEFKEFLKDEELIKKQANLKSRLITHKINQVNEVCKMIRSKKINTEMIKQQLQEPKYVSGHNSIDTDSKKLIKELLKEYVCKSCKFLKSTNDLDKKKLYFEEFQENYINLNNIKNDLKDYIPDSIDEIDQTLKELKSHIADFYKDNLESVKRLFQNFDAKGEEKLAILIKYSENLKGLKVRENIFKEMNNLNEKNLLIESIDSYLDNLVLTENMKKYAILFIYHNKFEFINMSYF